MRTSAHGEPAPRQAWFYEQAQLVLVHCAHADVLTLVHLSHSSHCEEWYCDSATLTLLADILHPRPRLKVGA